MDYKQVLKDLGWELNYDSFPIYIAESEDLIMRIIEKESGYHECDISPKKSFDRWANSDHINFQIYVVNYSDELKCGWTEDMVKKEFIQNLKDAQFMTEVLPQRLFNRGMRIQL